MNDLKENFTVDFDIDYKNDDEDIANNLYQSYFLKFFKLEEYDFEKIDPKIGILFEIMNNNENLKKILEKINSMYFIETSLQSVIFLFSFDYFYQVFPILKKIVNNEIIYEEYVNSILNNLI